MTKAVGHADELGRQLAEAAAVEEALDGAGDGVPTVAVGAVGEEARARQPQAPLTPWTEMAPTAIVNPDFVEEEDRLDDQDAGNQADEEGAAGADKGAGTGDGDQAGQHAVAHHARDRVSWCRTHHIQRVAPGRRWRRRAWC